jgi:amino acid transporter
MDAHSDDTEKKSVSFEASKDFDPVLVDPSEELSLHRGLKARQISMITVPPSLHPASSDPY